MRTVRVEDVGAVRTITLDRPERRNAMTSGMQEELIAAMEDAAASPSCGVVIFTGSGEAFCAGLDLEQLKGLVGRSPGEHSGGCGAGCAAVSNVV